MEMARGIEVPLKVDGTVIPEIRYGAGLDGQRLTYLVFCLSDDPNRLGRITFEGFDAIRCSRGEFLPYPDDRIVRAKASARVPWVFEVDNSDWLRQRHEYENTYYKTPLLEEYVHYLFSFHDEFVELIAKGIWLERVPYEEIESMREDHPLADLPDSLPYEEFLVNGLRCIVRHNPLSDDELIERSRLCTQIAFQYFVTLDGVTKPSYSARLRTRTVRGKSTTKLRGGLSNKDLFSVEGLGREADFRPSFKQWIGEVADRRRQMGK